MVGGWTQEQVRGGKTLPSLPCEERRAAHLSVAGTARRPITAVQRDSKDRDWKDADRRTLASPAGSDGRGTDDVSAALFSGRPGVVTMYRYSALWSGG